MPEQQEAGTSTPEPSFKEQVEAAERQERPEQPAAEAVAAPETEKVVEKLVPLPALHEERAQRKELQRQNRQLQEQFQQLQNQQVEVLRYLQSLQPQAKAPDPTQDPLGAQYHAVQELNQKVDSLSQQQQRAQAAQAQQQQYQQFRNIVQQSEQAFAQQKADYFDAVNFAMGRKRDEYIALGMDDDAATQRINAEAHQIAQMALQRGENPAAVAYRLAETMGYKSKAVSAEQKLAMQKEGQQAAMPSTGGGGQPNGRLSLDALAKLRGNDFLEATRGDKWRQLMGKQ